MPAARSGPVRSAADLVDHRYQEPTASAAVTRSRGTTYPSAPTFGNDGSVVLGFSGGSPGSWTSRRAGGPIRSGSVSSARSSSGSAVPR